MEALHPGSESKFPGTPLPGSVTWQSPSNIALIKYWGKHGDQLPCNASLSFTLDRACTTTSVTYAERNGKQPTLEFLFEGKPAPAFAGRIQMYLARLQSELPFLCDTDLVISSSNSFPHSSGIASSASAMSALALCLCSIDKLAQGGPAVSEPAFFRRASQLSRLGSGSACRSVYPKLALWGAYPGVEGSSDAYAIGMESSLHPEMQAMCDSILIVSSDKKAISSSAGHALMKGNPYAEPRYRQAGVRMGTLIRAMRAGDFETFGAVTEAEAMELHALMMASDPPYMLFLPATIAIIQELWAWRRASGLPVYFTLDAGPNVHLLYPETIRVEVNDWIDQAVSGHVETILHDRVGNGPKQLNGGT